MTKPHLERATRNLIAGLTASQIDLDYILAAIEAGANVNARGWWHLTAPRGKARLPVLALAALVIPKGIKKTVILDEMLRSGAEARVTVRSLLRLRRLFREEALRPQNLEDALTEAVRGVGRVTRLQALPVRHEPTPPPAHLSPVKVA
jgi:hypothetical protein